MRMLGVSCGCSQGNNFNTFTTFVKTMASLSG